jgi:diguanylate cyclase (GGDEF)-like protein
LTSPSNTQNQPVAQSPESSAALEKCSDQLKSVEMVLAETEAALQAAMEREKVARSLALHDPLTKLANRELFDERLANAIAIADRRSWSLAILFLDLDAFKTVNDAYGHAVGDIVLRKTADRLIQCCREEDTLCRYGGDEFLALLLDPKSRANIETILMRTRDSIRDPFQVEDQRITLDLSVGVAIYPTDGISGDELIPNADTAMYQAKINKSGWHFFSGDQGRQNG